MMASSNPEDWVNYDKLLQGPHANRLLEIVNRRKMTDCPYCIDMLTMDEQVTGMCNTCKDKCAPPVIDLTHLTDEDDEEYVEPGNIDHHIMYNSPMHHAELDAEAMMAFEFGDLNDFEYYPKDMAPELGGSYVSKRKREKSPEEQKRAQAQANEKRRKKDAQTNLKTLRDMIDGFQDISDQIKVLGRYEVPNSVINGMICKVDYVENLVNNLKLRSKI